MAKDDNGRELELALLRNKLAKSEQMGAGYKDRMAAIQKRIDELEKSDG